jgi:hypothetical protein
MAVPCRFSPALSGRSVPASGIISNPFLPESIKKVEGEEVFLNGLEKRIQREGGMKHGRQIELFRV